jgi:hypothetical protein
MHVKAQMLTLNRGESYDFLTNTKGEVDDGDFYFYYEGTGAFWANNRGQRGLKDLGNIGIVNLANVSIPKTGYTRFSVPAIINHTYVSLAQEGDEGSYIIFRIKNHPPDYSNVTIEYYYKPYQRQTIKTSTYVDTNPDQIVLGEKIELIGKIDPKLPTGASYNALYFRVIKPNGAQEKIGPHKSFYSSFYQKEIAVQDYKPTQNGTYQVIFYTQLEVVVNDFYESSFSSPKNFTVTESIPKPEPTNPDPDLPVDLSDFQPLILISLSFVIIMGLVFYIGSKLRPKPVWSNKKEGI